LSDTTLKWHWRMLVAQDETSSQGAGAATYS